MISLRYVELIIFQAHDKLCCLWHIDLEQDSWSGYLHYCASVGIIIIPFQVAHGPLIQSTVFSFNSFLTLLSCCRPHLHIKVGHNTAYNICFIFCRVLEIVLIAGLLLHSSLVMLTTLLYPLFWFFYCFSSTPYVKRIIHKAVLELGFF